MTCGLTRIEASITTPRRTRTGAWLFQTLTVYQSTAPERAAHSGRPAQFGSSRVSARSEWLMNGFDSSQSACVIVTGRVAANAAKTEVPRASHTAAACAATD